MLAADAIQNYKTVASFGCDDQIVAKYVDLNEKPFHEEAGKLTKFAFSYGLSQMIQNIVFGALYYASAQLSYSYAWMNGEKLWLALFAMMFGAF